MGAAIRLAKSTRGTITNAYGFYSITLAQQDTATLVVSAVGYTTFEKPVPLSSENPVIIELSPSTEVLEEVIVSESREEFISPKLGLVLLPVQMVKQLPALLGEKDVIKALQLLPGVQKGTEGSTALYVRGGGPDQNLILLDEAPVYNANHLFGFFSVFNGDAIKNVSFWKGGFPARYGGRLSSVIDLHMKDGGKDHIRGEGGIGLLSSRLTLDGPIKKDKASFLLSARRTYLDALTTPFMPKSDRTGYNFYDLNAKVNVVLTPRDNIYVSGYFGKDRLKIQQQVVRTSSTIISNSGLSWGNATASLRWNRILSQRLFVNTTLAMTDFRFRLYDDFERRRTSPESTTSTLTEFTSAIRDYLLKADFDYFPTASHQVKWGAVFTNHRFSPRAFRNEDREQQVVSADQQVLRNQEIGAYIEDTYTKNRFSANAGIRLNGLLSPGRSYLFIEPRLSVSYTIPSGVTLSTSYSRNNQFIHLLTNTGGGLSTDLWVPTTDRVPPQQADQVAIGISKKFQKPSVQLSIESYRKWLRNIVAYKEGATFLALGDGAQPLDWESNVTTGRGWSYGTELLLQKSSGKWTSWLGYTLSWSIHQFDELNGGKRFYPRYDRRHDLSLVMNYKATPKITISANWVYATGNALTVPQAYYFVQPDFRSPRTQRVEYLGSRNSFRAAPYHRLDLAVQFHKKKEWGIRTWEVGLFNAYNRKNPLYYYLKNQSSDLGFRAVLEQKSLFPIIPSVTYNFTF